MTDGTYEGRCFCGAIRFEAQGAPMVSGYEHLALFGRTPATPRGWCVRCGAMGGSGALLSEAHS
jgi:hypothetical protein